MIENDVTGYELDNYRVPFNVQDLSVIEKFIQKHFDENYHRLFPTLGKRSRRTSERPNYWQSTWGKLLHDLNLLNAMSVVFKKCRRCFHVPYPLFNEL
jgi:hypothetical protein